MVRLRKSIHLKRRKTKNRQDDKLIIGGGEDYFRVSLRFKGSIISLSLKEYL